MQNLIDLRNLKKPDFLRIINKASIFKKGPRVPFFLSNSIHVANLFLEPSTRTRISFEMAENHLGLKPLNIIEEASSLKKGESLFDTLSTLESLGCEIAVIRTSLEVEMLHSLQKKLKLPLINAGSGISSHPTQALLDLFTIWERFGRIEDLQISFVGDIAHSRVVASHLEMWEILGAKIKLCPVAELESEKFTKYEKSKIDNEIETTDILYLMRVQNERHSKSWQMTNEQYHEIYGLTEGRYQKMKKDSIVMHPGPFLRDKEIASSLFEKENVTISQQVENGVAIRMAILDELLGGKASDSLLNS